MEINMGVLTQNCYVLPLTITHLTNGKIEHKHQRGKFGAKLRAFGSALQGRAAALQWSGGTLHCIFDKQPKNGLQIKGNYCLPAEWKVEAIYVLLMAVWTQGVCVI